MDEATFLAALEAHRVKHGNPWSLEAQADLQALHLRRAEVLEAEGAAEGVAHLRMAEDLQWNMGSEATSAGEGIVSMEKLYELRARRARLVERLGDLKEALSLWESIAADKNGQGRFAMPEVARLREKV
jgi:hypothetical protein